MDDKFAVEALARCPLFERADARILESLAAGLRRRRFRRNEVIFHQGDPGDSLHVVAAGAVKIVLPSAEGEEAIIATLRPGDFFGELALLDDAPRSATASALEASDTLVLPRQTFVELLDTLPGLRDALLAGLARELRRLTGHVEELHFLDLAGRLAMRLTRLAREAQPDAQRPDPAGVAVYPVRSRGDDRWHAPEREPVAQRAGRRRADLDRARCAGDRRS